MNDFIQSLSDEFREIYFVKGERNGKIPYSHSLLLADHLIDTGISRKHIRKMKKEFQIKNVIFSHWHEDHTRDNQLFNNIKCFSHSTEKPIIEDARNFLKYYDVLNTPIEFYFENYLNNILRIRDTKIEKTLEDGEILDITDNLKLKIIHTPGHSAGHCCFYELNSKVAFFADIDLSSFGPWYGCLDSDLIDFEKSIDRLKKFDIEIVITGHNGLIEGNKQIKERLDKYKSIIFNRDDKILEFFSEKKPINVDELMGKKIIYHFYNDTFIEYLHIAEKNMLKKHFEKFLKNGIIEEAQKGYILS